MAAEAEAPLTSAKTENEFVVAKSKKVSSSSFIKNIGMKYCLVTFVTAASEWAFTDYVVCSYFLRSRIQLIAAGRLALQLQQQQQQQQQ